MTFARQVRTTHTQKKNETIPTTRISSSSPKGPVFIYFVLFIHDDEANMVSITLLCLYMHGELVLDLCVNSKDTHILCAVWICVHNIERLGLYGEKREKDNSCWKVS